MYVAAAAALIAAALLASAAPVLEKRVPATNIDAVVLNYALTLEHLEATFYAEGLQKFSQQDFLKAGYADWVRRRVSEIGSHEANHVEFLTTALQAAGATPVQKCSYSFGLTTPTSFLATAQILEGVGVSAYLGAATSITNPSYLTAAGSILTVEARHTAWIRSAGLRGDAFPEPYDTPLTFNEVYSLAAPFITNCPSSNPSLPVKAFPKLTAKKNGNSVTFSYDGAKQGDSLVFLSGLDKKVVPYTSSAVQIPDGFFGQIYVVAVSGNGTVSDDSTLAGPAIVENDISPAKLFPIATST